MTLDELRLKLPEGFRPWVDQYGPVFLAWTAEEVKAWIERLIAGDIGGAYAAVLKGLNNADLTAEWGRLDAEWKAANVANREKIEVGRAALVGLLKILLMIALAAVGL